MGKIIKKIVEQILKICYNYFMKKIIQLISFFTILLSITWLYCEPGFEPAITALAGLSTLIGINISTDIQKETKPKMRKKILYIDDDLLRTQFYMLEDSGYKVVPVNNANDALREIKKNKFDLILLDIMMPSPNFISKKTVNFGYETGIFLAKEIKKSLNKDAPIIVLTGNPQSSVEKEMNNIGITAYLRKPLQQKDLEEEIAHVLTRNKKNK